MKKNLLLIIAACAFFIPSVVFAKAPEYVAAEKSLYAMVLQLLLKKEPMEQLEH